MVSEKKAELMIVRFDVEGLTASALKILKAAVSYANEHAHVNVHKMPSSVLCELAGIPTLTHAGMCLVMNEVRKALVICEVVDIASRDREDLPYASWPVFNQIVVERANVGFNVSSRTFDPRLLAALKALKSTSRPG